MHPPTRARGYHYHGFRSRGDHCPDFGTVVITDLILVPWLSPT